MNLREEILAEHSKAQALRIAYYIGSDQDRFDELMELFFSGEWRINQRAAYSVLHTVEQHPFLFFPHLERAIQNLRNPVHVAVKRNTLRILEDMDIPEKFWGTLVDMCFEFLDSTKEAIAVRVFSMGVLFKIAKREPDLFPELKTIIEDHFEAGTAAFKSRGRKVFKIYSKKSSPMMEILIFRVIHLQKLKSIILNLKIFENNYV